MDEGDSNRLMSENDKMKINEILIERDIELAISRTILTEGSFSDAKREAAELFKKHSPKDVFDNLKGKLSSEQLAKVKSNAKTISAAVIIALSLLSSAGANAGCDDNMCTAPTSQASEVQAGQYSVIVKHKDGSTQGYGVDATDVNSAFANFEQQMKDSSTPQGEYEITDIINPDGSKEF